MSHDKKDYIIESNNDWGMLHLFYKAKLTILAKGLFKAVWQFSNSQGKLYHVSVLVKDKGRGKPLYSLLFKQNHLPKSILS